MDAARHEVTELQKAAEVKVPAPDEVTLSSTALSSKDARVIYGLNGLAGQVWEDAIKRAKFSLWVRAFGLDDERVVAALEDCHADGMDIRVIMDKGQIKNRGSSRTVERFKHKGIPLVLKEGPLLSWSHEEQGYIQVEEEYAGKSYTGNHHYKQMLADVIEPEYKAKIELAPGSGMITGSWNPTEYARAGNADDAVFVRRTSVVRLAAEDFQNAWWEEDEDNALGVNFVTPARQTELKTGLKAIAEAPRPEAPEAPATPRAPLGQVDPIPRTLR